MTMTKSSLLARFKAKLGVPASPEGVAIQDDMLGKMAEAIIEEIQQNGVVAVPATGIIAPNGACTGAAVGSIT